MKATKGDDVLMLVKLPRGRHFWQRSGGRELISPYFVTEHAAIHWACTNGYTVTIDRNTSYPPVWDIPKPSKSPDLDQLAAMAMQGLCAWRGYGGMAESIARDAYDIARAMLKEREK